MSPNTGVVYVDGNPIETEYMMINNDVLVPFLFLKNAGISVDIFSNHKFIVLKSRQKILEIRVNDKYASYCLNSSGKWQNEPCDTIVIEKYISLKFISEKLNMKILRNSKESRIYLITNTSPGSIQQLICHGDSFKNKVSLTFDDGPDNSATIKILDILRDKGVSATFFILGQQIEYFPKVLERILREGHQIGNHSFSHTALTQLTTSQVIKEINRTEEFIKSITGINTNIFRPPYGLVANADFEAISKLDYKIIGWNIDTKDYQGITEEEITKVIQREISPGSIILQHCSEWKPGILDGTIKALPSIIDQFCSEGLEFVTIDELLK